MTVFVTSEHGRITIANMPQNIKKDVAAFRLKHAFQKILGGKVDVEFSGDTCSECYENKEDGFCRNIHCMQNAVCGDA